MAATKLSLVFLLLLILAFNSQADNLNQALADLKKTAAANDIREVDELLPILKMNAGREFTDTFLPKLVLAEQQPAKAKYVLQSATGYTETNLIRFVATYVDGDYQAYTVTLLIPRTKHRDAAKFGLLDDYYSIEREQSEGREIALATPSFKLTAGAADCLAVAKLPVSAMLTVRTKSCEHGSLLNDFIGHLDLASLNRKLDGITQVKNE